MQIIKRNGKSEPVKFDKITSRIQKQSYGLNPDFVKPMQVAKKVIDGIFDGVTSVEMDKLAAETAAGMTTSHPDYAILAARIAVSSLHKITDKSFSHTMKKLHNYADPKTGAPASLIADDVYDIIRKNSDLLDSVIVYDRDFGYDYFGFKTLERSYLLKMNGHVAERPQHMIMRVSVGIHKDDLASVIQTYNLMSEKWMTHATPTLFNSGTPKPQMSSCFLLTMKSDSISGIYDTLKQCAMISQSAGGIGLAVSNVRATGSYIKGTGGTSNGLVPMLKVFNDTAKYVDQCFEGGTLIKAVAGDVKIQDLKIGDSIYNSNGVDVIEDIMVSEDETIEIITNDGSVRVTPGHLFLVYKDGQIVLDPMKQVMNGTANVIWERADNITGLDLLIGV